ncbi:hypothetical protein CE91St56_14130 [Lachnospiraceae bacterium]|nr:hypothetical protein CE91St56_14130 [Lachnospiraceae bacterium]
MSTGTELFKKLLLRRKRLSGREKTFRGLLPPASSVAPFPAFLMACMAGDTSLPGGFILGLERFPVL